MHCKNMISGKFPILAIVVCLLLSVPTQAQKTRYTVQIEAAPTRAEADAKVNQLKTRDVQAYVVKSNVPGKGTFYRVRVGSFPTMNDARRFGDDMVRAGAIPTFFVAVYEQPTEEPVIAAAPPKPAAAPPQKETLKPAAPAAAPPKPVSVAANPPAATPPVKSASSTSAPVPASSTATAPPPVVGGVPPTNPAAPAAGFSRFQDQPIGYSFEYPSYWTGQKLDSAQADEQRVNAGALFKSQEDAAFLNAIWNKLDKANSPENDNDLIVEIILKSMASSNGTQLKETSRKVLNEGGVIKTYLDLKAAFQTPGQAEPLDFMGKAVIIRASKGILLVVAFYSKDAPANSTVIAERIIASVRAPE
ncbi:MAG: SPOR domain-containing protein [Blastocatellia bacterium]